VRNAFLFDLFLDRRSGQERRVGPTRIDEELRQQK
jgi:hypothetical protein